MVWKQLANIRVSLLHMMKQGINITQVKDFINNFFWRLPAFGPTLPCHVCIIFCLCDTILSQINVGTEIYCNLDFTSLNPFSLILFMFLSVLPTVHRKNIFFYNIHLIFFLSSTVYIKTEHKMACCCDFKFHIYLSFPKFGI